jgi:hypothetical protein
VQVVRGVSLIPGRATATCPHCAHVHAGWIFERSWPDVWTHCVACGSPLAASLNGPLRKASRLLVYSDVEVRLNGVLLSLK